MKITKPPHYWNEAKKFLSKKDKKLAKIINQYDGYLVSRDDPFYSLCRSIIGQQISVKAADSIWFKL
jgi:DNA-3-methyladenine glycosylase II